MGFVIGVSKPCCPACHSLLHMLSMEVPSEPHFIWRARHSVVPALSLPVYLPDDMAHQLNMEFGALLRDHIVKLMPANFKTGRGRVDTTSSERLSVDSTYNEYIIQQHRKAGLRRAAPQAGDFLYPPESPR